MGRDRDGVHGHQQDLAAGRALRGDFRGRTWSLASCVQWQPIWVTTMAYVQGAFVPLARVVGWGWGESGQVW